MSPDDCIVYLSADRRSHVGHGDVRGEWTEWTETMGMGKGPVPRNPRVAVMALVRSCLRGLGSKSYGLVWVPLLNFSQLFCVVKYHLQIPCFSQGHKVESSGKTQ